MAGSDNCWRAGPGSGTALLAASAQPGRRGGTAAALSCPDHCTHHLLELAGEMGLDSSDIQSCLQCVNAVLPKAKTREGEHMAWVSWLLYCT